MKKTKPKSKKNASTYGRVKKDMPKFAESVVRMSPIEMEKIIHELHVYQAELQTQNERLRQAQIEATEAREKYADLYDFAPVGYFTFDKKGHIIETNVTGASLLGGEKTSLTGQPFRRFITPGYFGIFQSHLQAALDIQSKQSCQLKLTRKDGSSFDALIYTIAIMDGDGKFDHYRSSVTDITEITIAEEALLKTKEKIQTILESITDIYISFDHDWRFVDLNRQAESVIGKRRDEVLGKLFWEVFPQMKEGEYFREYQTAMATRSPVHFEALSFVGRWYETHAYPSEDGLSVYFRDITERKKTEEELMERTRQLEYTNKELESFSYSVSHDLRAPLRAIDGYARLILKKQGDKFDADTLDKFNVIRSSTHLMGQLIDDLLTFSRLGRKHMSLAPLDMDILVKDAWKEVQTSDPEKNIKLTVKIMPPGYGDRALIKQVLINLLSNAAKFTKYKDAANIEVGGCADGNEHVYYIKDNGVGFDMAYYDKLFGVFQRLHSTDQFEGTGVGLATIQRIIHRHGGRVWAEGKVDEGATFYFSLPSSHTQ
jgi:PAS domain S-box-containing protein